MPRRDLTDLIERLREQLAFLEASGDAYDRGSRREALRLAVALRVLLHDTPKQTSLLSQLGVLDDLRFLSTGTAPSGMNLKTAGLSALAPARLEGGVIAEHHALLHEAPRLSEQIFHVWWSDTVMAARGITWSRKDLVLALAHFEGGAHVDPKPKRTWVDLKQVGIGFSTIDAGGDSIPLSNPAIPSVRQIAFEVEVTLHEQLAEWVSPQS